MEPKKCIVIVIDNFIRGGAETLLVGILPELALQYRLVMVTLDERNEFSKEELHCEELYCLGYRGKVSFLTAVTRLRQILQRVKPSLVHAHLLNSSQIARLALVGSATPFVYSIHSMLSINAFNGSWVYRNLEKLLFNKKHHVVAVSKEVLQDYEEAIAKPGNVMVLPNYVADRFFSAYHHRSSTAQRPLKLVAIGNFKKVKNYEYVLRAFTYLNDLPVSLSIYGGGEVAYRKELQDFIDAHHLPVTLQPQAEDVAALLPQYHMLLLCSKNEGFGMAAAEAMAAGLPLIVSDLPVLRSVTNDTALFVDPAEPQQLAQTIQVVLRGSYDLDSKASAAHAYASQHYTKAGYLQRLTGLYHQLAC